MFVKERGLIMFTLKQLVLLGIIFIFLVSFSVLLGAFFENLATGVISVIVSVILVLLLGLVLNWYNTSTAAGIRGLKDHKSNMSNGIEREIIITAEDGREIFNYEGKIDVESNHVDNYIKFESEEGKRYIIYYGIQDTITIIEK